ncbi:MAG: G8 domain-containing protein [candidate division NC10 bacterium]|nr:G8 domain-containing protein [candidate division NC10 bacterium]
MTRRSFKDRVAPGGIIALIVASIATFQIGTAFAKAVPPVPCVEDDATPLSACIKKQNSPKNLLIGPDHGAECKSVYVDGSYTTANGNALGTIQIDKGGELFVPDQTVEIETAGISVEGLFQVGDSMCSIGPKNKVTITFTGSRPSSEDHTKGIVVQKDGSLRLFGARGVPGGAPDGVSWTHLSEAAGPQDKYGADTDMVKLNIGRPVPANGATTLQLAKDVAAGAGAWQDGDWIAIATTSFSPFETEFVQINAPVSKGAAGSTVTLKQSLKYYHFGGSDPGPPSSANFKAGADKNYGVDERAEVGLISRNIKLTAKIESGDNNAHWGGEIRILNGFKEVSIQGVEIEKFGKAQLGSYPIHFHLDGDVSGSKPLVNANSIHHSYNKCVTVHSTQNITIQNMVCARIVGHIFYQEIGDEEKVSYLNNLGLGAMSHYFDINAPTDSIRTTLIKNFWWTGDYLTNDSTSPNFIGYDGFRVPNTDGQTNPTHGRCTVFLESGDGSLRVQQDPLCTANQFYTEPPSGFWIINPGTELSGNSIGGCQGTGRGYWYVPPTVQICPIGKTCPPGALVDLHIKELGNFDNNRVHGCWGGLLGETDGKVILQQSLFPVKGGVAGNPPVIVKFNGITVTRNRGRGIWLRPTWYAVTNARLATNRLNVTLVSSGGLDGNSPGVWDLLQDSVVVGQSTNNVDRFGPCPTETPSDQPLTNGVGGKYGCIDQTPGPQHTLPVAQLHGGDIIEDCCGGGYPTPDWNFFGYMIYDGPVRIFNNHFVNFRVDPADSAGPGGSLWTTADQNFFKTYAKVHPFTGTDPLQNFIYEGDAALGWFDSNQSAYPTSTVGKGFTWTNVDLRHQVFTENVSRGGSGAQAATQFNDGDKNTAIIDLDGSLTGLRVVNSSKQSVKGLEPISLNNLPFNASSNSVDECRAEGAQDTFFEARPTSLISPGSMATLEFGALLPNLLDPPNCQDTGKNPAFLCNHTQIMTFSKDSLDFGKHQTMALHSRDRRGVWEPKVTSGYGYTVSACASKDPVNRPTDVTCNDDDKSTNFHNTGIPSYMSVGITDAVKPGIDPHPAKADTWFHVRLGICYTDKDGKHPSDASKFSITRGFKSYGGGETKFDDPKLQKFFNKLDHRYNGEFCDALDQQDPTSRNLCPDDAPGCTDGPNKGVKGCPAHGVTAIPTDGCAFPSTKDTGTNACIYGKTKLTSASSIGELTKDGKPVLDEYFYDSSTGMLFFNVVQDLPNAFGPSPLGSCNEDGTGDALCPKLKDDESYYACPAAGCPHYVVLLNDPTYQPGRSTCQPYETYAQNPPANENVLVLVGDTTNTPILTKEELGKDNKFPHHAPNAAKDTPVCPITTSP